MGTNATALTDDQRRPVPHAVLVDGVIPQQRAAHELQGRIHHHLPQLERTGALHRAEPRQRILIKRRANALDVRDDVRARQR